MVMKKTLVIVNNNNGDNKVLIVRLVIIIVIQLTPVNLNLHQLEIETISFEFFFIHTLKVFTLNGATSSTFVRDKKGLVVQKLCIIAFFVIFLDHFKQIK